MHTTLIRDADHGDHCKSENKTNKGGGVLKCKSRSVLLGSAPWDEILVIEGI